MGVWGTTIGREWRNSEAALNEGDDCHVSETWVSLREAARAPLFCLENVPAIPLARFTKVH